MKEKFDYIVLAPDAFRMTLRDRLVDARQHFQDALDVISRIKRPEERVVIKYRCEDHRSNFVCDGEVRVGYGTLLELCSENTAVIGFPGSALWECLLNDIRFFAFRDIGLFEGNGYMDMDAVRRLLDVIHVARNKDELFENITHNRIYKAGRSKKDLIHQKGMRLDEVVAEILGRQCFDKVHG